jgi:K+-transporting ATPase c subunit
LKGHSHVERNPSSDCFLIGLVAMTGLIYPLAMTGAAQVLFPYQAQGSLIERNGRWSAPR